MRRVIAALLRLYPARFRHTLGEDLLAAGASAGTGGRPPVQWPVWRLARHWSGFTDAREGEG
ncbi:hypothetical protein SBA3_1170015 [Candidatus Sulfopaludibacter sp. SbA3]|nr:hypothetical protein SBA3_1170015 [Candidatus Sulfopaludibacter sp. SbA3]